MEGWEDKGIYRVAHQCAIDIVREKGFFDEKDSDLIYQHYFLREVSKLKKEEKANAPPKQKRPYIKRDNKRWGI